MPLAVNLHLFGDYHCHLVDIVDGLAASSRSRLNLVLLQEHLQPDILDGLRVQSVDLRDQVLLTHLYFLQQLDFILLDLKLGF